MTFPKAACVKLGTGKTGLSGGTLGYTIKSLDGVNTYQARTVSNIAELGSSGDYFATINYDGAWPYVVRIEWDDSASSPTFRVGEELEMPHYFVIWPRRVFAGKGGHSDAASSLINDALTWDHRRSTIAGATLGTLGGALSQASIAQTPIDLIVGPGSFPEVNKINLRSSASGHVRINLFGSGLGSTVIRSAVPLADPGGALTNVSRGCAIVPGNGSVVSDLTIIDDTNDGEFWAGIGQNSSFDNASIAYRFERLWIIGDSDGVYDNYFGGAGDSPAGIGQIVVGKNSHIHTNYHQSRTFWSWQHHVYSFIDFLGVGPSMVDDGANETAGVVPTSSRVDLIDCNIRERDGVAKTFGVYLAGAAEVNMIRTRAHAQSSTGIVYDIYNGDGVNVLASHYDPTKVFGTPIVHPLRGVDATQIEATDASTLIDARIGAANLATAAAVAAVETDTQDIQSRLPAALVSGRMDSHTGAMASNVINAAAIHSNAIAAIQNGLATATALATVAGDVTQLGVLVTAINAKTTQLTFTIPGKVDSTASVTAGASIVISSPVDVDDDNRLTLIQGDDHDGGDRLPSWTITNYAGPSLSGATAKLRLLEMCRYERRGTEAEAQLEVDATVNVSGSTITITAPITAAQSALLSSSPPVIGDTHKYHIIATTSGGKSISVILGPVTVTRRIEPAE